MLLPQPANGAVIGTKDAQNSETSVTCTISGKLCALGLVFPRYMQRYTNQDTKYVYVGAVCVLIHFCCSNASKCKKIVSEYRNSMHDRCDEVNKGKASVRVKIKSAVHGHRSLVFL